MFLMTPERLQQLAERYEDEMIRPEHVAELIDTVYHLTAENARLREEVRSLQRSSQRNADAHMVTHRDNARLRAGIEYLTRVGYSHTPDCDREREAGWLKWHPDCGRCWEERLIDLINPPTEEYEPCCRYCGEPGSDCPGPCC